MNPETSPQLDALLVSFTPHVIGLVLAARTLVFEEMPDVIEQVDPSANLIAYGTNRTYKGLVCGIMVYKTYINLMFARGANLPDPDDLLKGTGKEARHIRIGNPVDLANPGVRRLLESAVVLHAGK
jgi:hypothetical protein